MYSPRFSLAALFVLSSVVSAVSVVAVASPPGKKAAKAVVSAASFGALPDDGRDDAAALRAAAAYCRSHPGTTLVLPPGIYDFIDSRALKIESDAISGALGRGIEVQQALFQPRKPYVTGLDFTGCRDLTVKASGAVLRVGGWMQVLSFVKARNVVLEGLTVTYRRPAATEGLVVASTPHSFDIMFDPRLYTCIDSVVQGRYHFYSSVHKHFYNGHVGHGRLLRPGLIRFESTARPPVGDYCIIRYGGHYRPCIMLKESRDVTLRNVSILSFPGMGVVGHLTENILVDGLKVVPEHGRYCSTTTDATHFTSCSGLLTIRNSVFRGNGDDCTNIHNYYYTMLPQAGHPDKVEIRIENADLHAQSLDYPSRGDTMLVVSRNDLSEHGRYVVRNVETSLADWRVVVTLDRTPDVGDAGKYYMVNATRYPKVRILNNRVYYNMGRAFLLKAPDVEVRGNSITGSTLAAIKLGAEMSWREAGPVSRVVVDNNYIYGCGTDVSSGVSGVMVTTEAPATPAKVNRNIVISNNIFDSAGKTAILLRDADNVVISGNVVDGDDYVEQHNCSNVTVDDLQLSVR